MRTAIQKRQTSRSLRKSADFIPNHQSLWELQTLSQIIRVAQSAKVCRLYPKSSESVRTAIQKRQTSRSLRKSADFITNHQSLWELQYRHGRLRAVCESLQTLSQIIRVCENCNTETADFASAKVCRLYPKSQSLWELQYRNSRLRAVCESLQTLSQIIRVCENCNTETADFAQ